MISLTSASSWDDVRAAAEIEEIASSVGHLAPADHKPLVGTLGGHVTEEAACLLVAVPMLGAPNRPLLQDVP